MWNGLISHPHVMGKNMEGLSQGLGVPAPHQAPLAQGSSASKISPHNFWLQNQQGLSQWKKLLESQAVPLKESTHELTQTHSL